MSKSNNFTFNNTSTGTAANSAIYTWYLLDPVNPPEQKLTWPKNPGIQQLVGDGEGYITLVAYDAATNCYDSSKVRIVISEPPTANFTFNNNNECQGTVISFTNTSAKVYPYTTYFWDFGDGTNSTLKNPTHSYTAPGTYSVTVKTTNHTSCEQTSAPKVVTVTSGPQPSFTFGNFQCANTAVTFTSTSTGTSGSTSYSWDFGDGATGTGANPTHTYTLPGTYNVELTVSNGATCSNTSLPSVITILEAPVPNFTFTNNNECAGTVISFSNVTTGTNGSTTYFWDFGDGSNSTLDNPTHTYATAGTYSVTLMATNGTNCKVTSSANVVTVTSSPVSSFTFTNDNQCAGTVLSFTNTSTGTTGASSYEWSFGDGVTSTQMNPTHSYGTGGTYNVTLTVKNAGSCMNVSVPKVVTVKATPVATFTFNSPSCTSTSVTFTNTSSTNGAAGTYAWDFGDGTNSSQENPVHVYGANGTYSVTLTITNVATGCSHTSAVSKITIGSLPPVLSFTMSPLTGCSPRTVTFTNTSSGAVPTSNYDWNFGNGTSLTGIKDPPAQLYNAGTYTIRLISGNACGTDTLYKTLIVDTVPKAVAVAKPLKGCLPISFTAINNSTGGNLKYQWFVNGVLTDTTKIPSTKTFTTAPNTVQLKISNSCGSDDTTFTITSSPKVETTISPLKSTICAANDFTFTYSQTSIGDSLTYFWDFGNGNTSTLPNPPAQTFLNGATYYPTLIVTGACGKDTSVAKLTVYEVPATPTVRDTTICSGTSATLIATAPGEKYEWFDAPGGTLLKVGATFKTPALTKNTTYYVQSTISDCTSPLKPVNVIVKPLPLPPTVTNDTICAGETAQVIASSGAGNVTFEWFSALTGGTKIDSVAAYTTPALTTTTSYFAQTVLNGCPSTPRTKATVVVNPIPSAPNISSIGICEGTSTILNPTPAGGMYNWYSALTGGTLLSTGATFTTPVLTKDTVFYVEKITPATGCVSSRKAVTITVSPAPLADISADITKGCTGMQVTFTNNSTTGASYSWSFKAGNPVSSTQYSPGTVQYPVSGIHLAYLEVNVGGCKKYDSIQIYTYPSPVAKYDLSVTESCSPLTVSIINKSVIVTGDTYLWDFDNGTTSTLPNPPSQTYTASGLDSTYTISLVITSLGGCKDTSLQKVIVHTNPIAAFKPNINKACINEKIGFTSESIGALSWNWSFGDGGTSTDKQPFHQYAANGTYTVKLVITGAYGCKDSITHDVIVNPSPAAFFTATTNCSSAPVQFTDSSANAVSWQWNFGDASPLNNTQSPLHLFPGSGTYDVMLKVTNTFGCADSTKKKVTVLESPDVDFAFKNVCARDVVTFTDSTKGKNFISWNWDFGDGTTSTSQNNTHIYPIAGVYPVSLIVKNNLGCADTAVKSISVSTLPTPLFKANVTCLGKITSFTDLSTDVVPIKQWFYDFGDGNNSISQNPNYVYANPGVYNVSLTVTNINGCDSTYNIPVTVDAIPKANYVADTICVNNPTTFTDISTGSVIRWEWDFGDGSKDTVGPVTTHVYAASGSYLTSLKIYTAGGCSDERFKMVIVRSDVKAAMIMKDSACVNELVQMKDNSTSAGTIVTISWNFGDGSPEVYTTNASHAFSKSGMYIITHTVIGLGGCLNKVTDTLYIATSPDADFVSANTCIGQESNFTDKSTGSPTAWSWNFNDGNFDTNQNPKHIYEKAGVYNVKLTVQTTMGCFDTITKKIIVYMKPKASFTTNVSCWGDTTNFMNTSNPMDGSIIKTWWDFDDGTNSNVLNPNHVLLTKKDSFQVKMVIITSHGCMDTVVKTVVTFPIPTFKFKADLSSGCNPFSTRFHDSSTVRNGTIVNWLWNFGDKSLTYKNDPVHVYTKEGKFYVSLTLTTSDGCRMTDTLKYPIVVYPKPVAGFSAKPAEASMYEPTIKIIDESQKAIMWDWDLGDQTTSTDQNFTHTYADTGTFVITQVAINEFGCRDTIQHNVRINGEPTIFIPNAFSPDGNGINDVFIPKMYGVREFNMSIYDRWGDLVFTSVDSEVGWNGKVNGTGELVKDDTYIYIIYIRDLLGNPRTYKGRITLLKRSDRQ
jgi:gliding motility-associated-like protein